MKEECVVIAGVVPGAVELVVGGILETDACVGPRPSRRLADAERDVGDLSLEAVAVWAVSACEARKQDRVRAAPYVKILAGEHDLVVAPVGERRLQLQ